MAGDWRSFESNGMLCLIRTVFTDTDYSVYVSDLQHIWAESLDQEAIAGRAREVESPISPDTGQNQVRILLAKLEACLGGKSGTTKLIDGIRGRVLELSIPLPKPFGNLEWRIDLKQLPLSAMQEELFNPLISLAFNQQQQIEDLTCHLTEKDHVLGRMLDTVERLNIDPGTLFPNARLRKRGNVREQIEKAVKGLEPFNKERWLGQDEAKDVNDVNSSTLLSEALKGTGSTKIRRLARILEVKNTTISRNIATLDSDLKTETNTQPMKTQPDDEFQRQATQDCLQSSTDNRNLLISVSRADHINADDESTEDDDDLDALPRRFQHTRVARTPLPAVDRSITVRKSDSPKSICSLTSRPGSTASASPSPVAMPSVTILGKIGSRKAAIADDTSSTRSRPYMSPCVAQSNGKRKLGAIGGITDRQSPRRSPTGSISRAGDVGTVQRITPPPKPLVVRKLGKIGGRQPPPEPTLNAPDDDVDKSNTHMSATIVTASKRKLGGLGRRIPTKDVPQPSSNANTTIMKEASPDRQDDIVQSIETGSKFIADDPPDLSQVPKHVETAEEKAERKREALKRELEEAKPVAKKKRKF